jgi:hypothetical protein
MFYKVSPNIKIKQAHPSSALVKAKGFIERGKGALA